MDLESSNDDQRGRAYGLGRVDKIVLFIGMNGRENVGARQSRLQSTLDCLPAARSWSDRQTEDELWENVAFHWWP